MSLTQTYLTAACAASDSVIYVNSTSGFPAVGSYPTANQPLLIDGEYMAVVTTLASGVVQVRMRGDQGTAAAAHDVLADVYTSSNPSDFPAAPIGALNPRPPNVDLQITVGQNGVIPVPAQNTTANLVKATALSSTTLGAPNDGANGVRLTLTSQTAAAHVVTATTLINDGASGAPHTTMTFAAYAGASIVLEAQNGLWNVISNNNVTVS